MNKIVSVLLVLILLAIVFGFRGMEESMEEAMEETQDLGYAGFNDLGYDGMTHATSAISASISTGTTHTVMDANGGRLYARIRNDTAAAYFTLQLGASTLEEASTTPLFSTGLVKGLGIFLDPGEEYIIGPDNLWKGAVVALASSTATATINYIEK